MAKIPTTRLNTAPEEYQKTDFDQLIEDLQDLIKVLNSTYGQDVKDEEDRRVWYFMRGN